MTDETDKIPIDGEWRGVGLHAGQSEDRLRTVRADIDDAHLLRALDDLADFARDIGRAPEARYFAKLKCLALLDDAVERRAPRSKTAVLDRDTIKALAPGFHSLKWQSRWHYGSVLDGRPPPGLDRRVKREVPLPDKLAK
ncbi:MAG: hypothetical protein JSR78_16240 [Proteobacteria bacterium]|nr:hypothetical protein [Pseudomonadota bacterium]